MTGMLESRVDEIQQISLGNVCLAHLSKKDILLYNGYRENNKMKVQENEFAVMARLVMSGGWIQ